MSPRRQSGSSHTKGPRKGKALKSLQHAAKAARSGLRRYPRAILDSIVDPTAARLRARAGSSSAPPSLESHDLAAIWLGHASVLLRFAGLTILADPVFAHRIGVSLGPLSFGLPRHSPMPLKDEHLPSPDLVLISHAHFDHLDKPTLRRIADEKTTVVTARRTSRLIPRGFGNVIELDWDQSLTFRGLHLSAIRPEHWGARTALDRRRGFNSYILREGSPSGHARGVLMAGDTAYTDAFNKVSNLALAIMGIGAYEPWAHAHATPEETWDMFRASGAERLLPIHHSTFPLGDEQMDEPMQRLLTAAGDDAHRVIRAGLGDVWAA